MKITLAATALAIALTGFAAPAHATRVTNNEPDRCSNMAGHQGAAMFALGYVEYKTRTERPNDCRPGWYYDQRG